MFEQRLGEVTVGASGRGNPRPEGKGVPDGSGEQEGARVVGSEGLRRGQRVGRTY